MNANENNYAFIDSQNLNLAIRDQGWELDFRRFRQYLKDAYDVTKAFIFIGYVPTNQNLYTALQQKGYILILNLPCACRMYSNYDKAVIATGDGDCFCLIEHLKKQGKLKKLIIPNQYKYSSLLRKFATDMLFMNGLRGKLEYK